MAVTVDQGVLALVAELVERELDEVRATGGNFVLNASGIRYLLNWD